MTPPRRQLGLVVTAAIVVANMIGVGVFTSTGFQAQSLHDPPTILLAWIVGGVIALCGAAAYAELGSMMPEAGGEYVYLREAYHPAVGFMSGWVSMTAGFSAPIAAASLAFAKYLATLVPALQTTTPWAAQKIDLGLTFTLSIRPEQAVAIRRLPALQELLSMVDPTQENPALPSGHPFVDAGSTANTLDYWSATTDPHPMLTGYSAWASAYRGKRAGAIRTPAPSTTVYGVFGEDRGTLLIHRVI